MKEGSWYSVVWDDDPQEYILKLVRFERGFYIFVDEGGLIFVARPDSIRCREANEKLAGIYRASPVSKGVVKLSSVSGVGSGARDDSKLERRD